jgi:hypothetical protein
LPEEITELAILVPFWVALLVLLPQEHESYILVGNQLLAKGVPVRLRTGNGRRTVAGWIKKAFQCGVV